MTWATPMATGVVTDLGASDSTTAGGRPSHQAINTAEPAALAPPSTAAISSLPPRWRRAARRSHSGQAMATTAGPSIRWMSCAPAK